jgi:hypothetical protein
LFNVTVPGTIGHEKIRITWQFAEPGIALWRLPAAWHKRYEIPQERFTLD